jgi:EAL and modified HD-GYP domain-containing signal transduction protein
MYSKKFMEKNGHALLARQPIYNRSLEIAAYELLFRGEATSQDATFTCGDKATSQVLLNAFGEAGIVAICGKHPAYINFTKNLILDRPPFDPGQYVIEILEDIEVDNELISALKDARKEGCKLALDDFILNKNSAPLLALADIVKIDVLSLSTAQIERYVKVFKRRNLTLLAEKVETHEMFQFCKDLGFHLFQGYFLSRPQIVEGRSMPDNKILLLKLIQDLQDPDISAESMTKTLSKDPQMSFKLLRLVNSSAFVRIEKCTSLQQAVTRLGMSHVRSWATLLSLGSLEDKPVALRQTSLERAIICQKLGDQIGKHAVHEYYTVGLFSLLDAFLDRPILEIIKSLQLPLEMEAAILSNASDLGLTLHTAKCFQEGRLGDLKIQKLEEHGLTLEIMDSVYKQALIIADEQFQEIK